EKSPVTMKPGHYQVAQRFDDGGCKNGLLVTVTIGEAAGKNRDEGLGEIPAEHQPAVGGHGYAQAAFADGEGGVESRHCAHAVIGEALDHFHGADYPKDVAEAGDGGPETELLDICEGSFVRGWHRGFVAND